MEYARAKTGRQGLKLGEVRREVDKGLLATVQISLKAFPSPPDCKLSLVLANLSCKSDSARVCK